MVDPRRLDNGQHRPDILKLGEIRGEGWRLYIGERKSRAFRDEQWRIYHWATWAMAPL